MRKESGMRLQDILILIERVVLGEQPCCYGDLAKALHISQSEVAESLSRNQRARLVAPSKRRVFRSSLLELLVRRLKYVSPVQPGPVVWGVPTAHAAPLPLSRIVPVRLAGDQGSLRGQAVAPSTPARYRLASKTHSLMSCWPWQMPYAWGATANRNWPSRP